MEIKTMIETILELLSTYTSSLNSLGLEQLKTDLEKYLGELRTSLGIFPDTHETNLEVNDLIIELGRLIDKLEKELKELENSPQLEGSEKSREVESILQRMLQIVKQNKDETKKAEQEIECRRFRQPPPLRGWER